jgi:hydroxymethylpyrimidine/phosphomethylpyrimidine kinase
MAPVALTIAGSDPIGGAGLQADLATFHAFAVHGAGVLTALTVQNTSGVRSSLDLEPTFVAAQLDAVLGDLGVAAAKTGLLGRAATVRVVAERLRARPVPWLVVDPVLVATGGFPLTEPGAVAALRERLLPLASLVTPNLAEAAALAGRPVTDVGTARDAARALVDLGARAALVTGGHLAGPARDVLCWGGRVEELEAERVPGGEIHGAGCALSAAVTASLARGRALPDAVRDAKRWLTRAIAAGPALGRGRRTPNHLTPVEEP